MLPEDISNRQNTNKKGMFYPSVMTIDNWIELIGIKENNEKEKRLM